MGLTPSKRKNISNSILSNDIEDSYKQVFSAFREDNPILPRRNDEKSKRDLSNTEKHDKAKVANQNNRSRSSDELRSNENEYVSINSSVIRRSWHCQLCETLNQTDSQLCSHCGSSKINVYIPIMNYIDKINIQNHQQNDSLTLDSDSVKARHENWNNENLVKQDNIYRRSVLITHKRQADEHIVLKHFEKLLNNLTFSHSQFKDETFPASLESLYINGNSLSQSTLALLPETLNQTDSQLCSHCGSSKINVYIPIMNYIDK
ncbi:unnamed protein product, partial [Rotaria sp. Silwood2]